MSDIHQDVCSVISNTCLQGNYWRMLLNAPKICKDAAPGQFVHLQVPNLEGHILRRPFSICDVQKDILTIVYKVVGKGTDAMKSIVSGMSLDILGPIGHGFSEPPVKRPYFLLGGGYGCAAMLFTARRAIDGGCNPPTVLLGARTADDILLAEDFSSLGCNVQIATDDGSMGTQGRITVLLEKALTLCPNAFVAACGPRPMLKAVALMTEKSKESTCEVSLDERMCCGVGACFGCVLKVKDDTTEQGWKYLRSCKEGPVFPAESIVW